MKMSTVSRALCSPLVILLLSIVAPTNPVCGQGDPREIYTGSATGYSGTSGMGAYGFPASEVATLHGAMNAPQAESGTWGGAWVEVSGPAGVALLQIVDFFPEGGDGDLDLSPDAFEAVTGEVSGIYPISWHWISAPGELGPIRFYSLSSNSYYLRLLAANIVNPVDKMEILIGGEYVEMEVTSNHSFEISGTLIEEPFTIRVTDILGNEVVSTGLTITATEAGQDGGGNFPPVIESSIAIEQPVGNEIANGGRADPIFSIDGEATLVEFALLNLEAEELTDLVATLDGTDAAYFSITSAPSSTLAGGGMTTLELSFTAADGVTREATLRVTNSADLESYDIQLLGQGAFSSVDRDLDGMNDAAEVKLSALGFDWEVAQNDLVDLFYENASTAGLYTTEQVQDLNVGTPILQRNPESGRFTLTIALQQSPDLESFTSLPFSASDVSVNESGEIEFEFSSTERTEFYRLFVD